jgi:hypothetical protein
MKKRKWQSAVLAIGLTVMDGTGNWCSGAGFNSVAVRTKGHVHTQKDERISSRCRAFQRDHSRWL